MAQAAADPKIDAQLPGGGTAATQRKMRTHIIEPQLELINKAKNDTAATKELPPDDLFQAMTADGRILLPPFDKLVLAMLTENSSSLGPVVSAMAQNCDGFGHHLESRVKMDDPNTPEPLKKKVLDERAKLTNFFKNCTADYSFTELRRRTRTDMETTGEAFWEVIRTASGVIVGFNHIPSYQINLGPQDLDLTTYERKVSEIQPDGSVNLVSMKSRKRFRTFVQSRINSTMVHGSSFQRTPSMRFFKELNDPRVIDNTNGQPVPEAKIDEVPEPQRASELIHFKIYSPRTPHGLPRFVGNLITLFGDRAADEVNYNTLRNNNVPSMMILCSNGQLTQGSLDRLQQYVNAQVAGQNNYSKIIVVEAEGAFEGEESGIPKMSLEKLTSEQMRDQLFQEYSKNNGDKIRQCFRLPPIFIGRSEDYTRSTAEASRRLADEQVFSPEREEFDNLMNQLILPQMDIIYHMFVSNGPNVTDDEDLINVMGVAERSGGMTPKMARQLLADILGMDEHALPPLDPSIKPDVPFTIQVAEAVKNMAEPGHQLAVKSLNEATWSPALSGLMRLREQLELAILSRSKNAGNDD